MNRTSLTTPFEPKDLTGRTKLIGSDARRPA